MRVEVKFHDSVYADLAAWRRTLGADERQRREMYAVSVRAMADEFQRSGGVPPLARPDPSVEPPLWVWKFSGGLYVLFVVRDVPPRPRGWWDIGRWLGRVIRPRKRVVVLTGLRTSPPRTGG